MALVVRLPLTGIIAVLDETDIGRVVSAEIRLLEVLAVSDLIEVAIAACMVELVIEVSYRATHVLPSHRKLGGQHAPSQASSSIVGSE